MYGTVKKFVRNIVFSKRVKPALQKILNWIHYDYGHWSRTIMYRECTSIIQKLEPEKLDVLEISAGQFWQQMGFKSYTEANYPDFDICSMVLPKQYDLIIADQIFEHLLWPYRAGKNVYAMLKPGGCFLVTTPFMVKVHDVPVDCSRWTELGMKHLLAECGFPMETIKADSWGNRACVKANFNRWARRGWFKSLANEPEFPVSVWVLARK